MNLKKIIVYQDNVLFSILNEIKENFNFEVFKANKKNSTTISILIKMISYWFQNLKLAIFKIKNFK